MKVPEKMSERFYKPMSPDERSAAVKAREKFEALNRFVTERHGWITSVPGERAIRIECLPLPGELETRGYIVEKIGETQRILPHAVVQKFETSSSGALVPPTEDLTNLTSVKRQR